MQHFDPYIVIGVSRNATPQEIRTAYIARCKVLHPDRFDRQTQPKEWAQANNMLSELNSAYDALRKPPHAPPKEHQQQTPDPPPSSPPHSPPPPRKKRGWFAFDWERSRGQACFFILVWSLAGFYEAGTALMREFRIDSVPHKLTLMELERGAIPDNRFLRIDGASFNLQSGVVHLKGNVPQEYYIPLVSETPVATSLGTDSNRTTAVLKLSKTLFDEYSSSVASKQSTVTVEGVRILSTDTQRLVSDLLKKKLPSSATQKLLVLDGGRQPVGMAGPLKYFAASTALFLVVIAIYFKSGKLGSCAIPTFVIALLALPSLSEIHPQYRSAIIGTTRPSSAAQSVVLAANRDGPEQPHPRQVDAAFDIKSLARNATPAVALLTVRDATGKETGIGTGFFVRANGRACLVTCLHVITGARAVSVRTSSGDEADARGLYAFDADADLAVLALDSVVPSVLPLGESASLEIGERIGVIGNPRGLEGTVSEGILSAKRGEGSETAIMQISAPVSSGSSGSPVLNARGEVCAIAIAVMKNAQALNFAVPAEFLKNLLNTEATQSAFKTNAVQTFHSVNERMAKENGISSPAGADTRARLAAAVVDGDYLKASRITNEWIDAHPYDAPAYAALAMHLVKLRDWQAAETAVRSALSYDDGNDRYWKILGDIHSETLKWSAAKSAYYEAVKRNKKDETLLIRLARLSSIEKEYDLVISSFESALELNANADVSWWMLAEAHERTGEMQKAIAAYRKQMDAAPGNCYYMCKVALRLAWNGQKREAEQLLRKARKSDFFYHAKVAALARQRSGNAADVRAERLEKYQMAVALNPEVYSHWYGLSYAWDAAGRSKEAEAARDTARSNPTTSVRRALKTNLHDIQMLMAGLVVTQPANSMRVNYGIDAFWPDLWEECVFTQNSVSNQSVSLRNKLQERRELLERHLASEVGVLLHPAVANRYEAK